MDIVECVQEYMDRLGVALGEVAAAMDASVTPGEADLGAGGVGPPHLLVRSPVLEGTFATAWRQLHCPQPMMEHEA